MNLLITKPSDSLCKSLVTLFRIAPDVPYYIYLRLFLALRQADTYVI